MPKMNLGLSGVDQGAAEGYEAWPEDKLPPTGTYRGLLKVCQIGKTGPNAKNANKNMLKVGVELVDPGKDWNGYVTFRNLVLIDSVIPYVNQFLRALTDGSESAFEKIKRAFYENGPIVDDKPSPNVLKIGTYKVDSPEGKIPVVVSVKRGSYTPQGQTTPVANANIVAFLLPEGTNASAGGSDDEDEPVEEDTGDVADATEDGTDETGDEEASDETSGDVFDEEGDGGE